MTLNQLMKVVDGNTVIEYWRYGQMIKRTRCADLYFITQTADFSEEIVRITAESDYYDNAFIRVELF